MINTLVVNLEGRVSNFRNLQAWSGSTCNFTTIKTNMDDIVTFNPANNPISKTQAGLALRFVLSPWTRDFMDGREILLTLSPMWRIIFIQVKFIKNVS